MQIEIAYTDLEKLCCIFQKEIEQEVLDEVAPIECIQVLMKSEDTVRFDVTAKHDVFVDVQILKCQGSDDTIEVAIERTVKNPAKWLGNFLIDILSSWFGTKEEEQGVSQPGIERVAGEEDRYRLHLDDIYACRVGRHLGLSPSNVDHRFRVTRVAVTPDGIKLLGPMDGQADA